MRCNNFPLVAFLAGALPAGIALSQDAAPTAFEVRAVDGMPSRLQVELAAKGEPKWYTVEESGTTLKSAISQTCGTQPSAVEKALEAEGLRLNGLETVDAPIEEGVTLAIPFCLPISRNVEVEVQEGDTVENLLRKHTGVFGQRTLQKTFDLNKNRVGSRNQERFFRRLPVGETIQLPYEATPRVFVGRTVDTDLPQIVREFATPQIAAAIETASSPAEENVLPDPGGFSLVETVEIASVEGDTPCSAAEDLGRPVDMQALKAVFDEEHRLMARAGDEMETAHIGIIDTGLESPEDNFFGVDVLAINPGEMHGVEGEDDDIPPNDATDDIFGINLNNAPVTGDVLPYAAARKSWQYHGTRMASLLLGGPNIAADWGAARPPIKLRIVNFASSLPSGGMVAAIHLNTAIGYLQRNGTDIINVSLSNKLNHSGVKEAFSDRSGMLFVVAAGNKNGGQGEDLIVSNLFPALYGGLRGTNVLTVGAHGRNGTKAPFSYYSREFVDLLAPGCGVETRNGDGNTVLDSGTSPAAAIVSFTAGLLKSAGLHDPGAIKTRILAATDADERLAFQAWSKGRLNAVKALSLRRDVIQTTDGALHFGTLADRSPLWALCADGRANFSRLRDIYKVALNIRSGSDTVVEYWTYSNGILSPQRCMQRTTADGSLTIGTEQLAISDVRDVVFKWR